MPERRLAGRVIVLAGATSAAGLAVARAATAAGAHVVAVGRDGAKLDALRTAVALEAGVEGSLRTDVCDLGDESAVTALADRVRGAHGRVDGVLHLVGGWRGGGGLAGQSDEDYRFLDGALTALRHVSRAFDDDLNASDAGRQAIVSSTVVERPLAGGANYATVKAASETWMRAVAQGFVKTARGAGRPPAAASVIFRVKALDGLEVRLADAFVGLWDSPAAELNATIVDLSAA